MTPALLLASAATPLLLALGLLVGALRRHPAWTVIAPLPALAAALGGHPEKVRIPWVLLDAHLTLDEVARTFLLLTATVWLLAGVYAQGYVRRGAGRAGFHAFHLLAMAGNIGLVIAADLVSFYFFFALMSFSAYGLVIHDRTPEALRAGRVYMVMAVAGDATLLAGMLMVAGAMPGPDLSHLPETLALSHVPELTVWLLAAGLGVKAAVLPLHLWLPLAHPVAPTPASAVLSGAMIKAGLLGWLRMLPLGAPGFVPLGTWAVLGGLAAAFFAVLVGVTQRDPKTVLAYSSISQMGLATVALGGGLLTPDRAGAAVAAVSLFALHHGLAKASLFLSVGVAEGRMPRAARPWMALGVALPVLSMAAAPATSGAVAKKGIEAALGGLPPPWDEVAKVLLSLTSAATLVLLLRFGQRLKSHVDHASQPPRRSMVTAWGLSVITVVGLVWMLPWAGAPRWVDQALAADALVANAWPLGVGLSLAVGLGAAARRWKWRPRPIPAGDVVVVGERAVTGARAAWRGVAGGMEAMAAATRTGVHTVTTRAARGAHRVLGADEALSGWTAGATLAIALAALLVAWLAWR